jgi:hypothetical protein
MIFRQVIIKKPQKLLQKKIINFHLKDLSNQGLKEFNRNILEVRHKFNICIK